MDSIEDYWPTLAGILAVMLGAVVLWPGEKEHERDPLALVQHELPTLPPAQERKGPPIAGLEGRPSKESELPSAGPKVEYREYLIAVPSGEASSGTKQHTQDDPEVKRALSQVEVVLYESDSCEVCKKAGEYLTHNKVSFTRRNVDRDTGAREKARRLSGGTSVPVIVVDGNVLRGFSEGSVQAALNQAVKTRVTDAQL